MSNYEKLELDGNWKFLTDEYKADLMHCSMNTLQMVLKERKEILNLSQKKLEIIKEVIKEKEKQFCKKHFTYTLQGFELCTVCEFKFLLWFFDLLKEY